MQTPMLKFDKKMMVKKNINRNFTQNFSLCINIYEQKFNLEQ